MHVGTMGGFYKFLIDDLTDLSLSLWICYSLVFHLRSRSLLLTKGIPFILNLFQIIHNSVSLMGFWGFGEIGRAHV